MFNMKSIIKFGFDIAIMFSLMIMMLSAHKVGLLEIISKPIDKLKNSKSILMFWFIFSFLITGLIPDTLAATIIAPIAIIYASNRNIDKIQTLIAVGIGCVAGSDLTYFGGGDNIIAWKLLEKKLGHNLDMHTWSNVFLTPTLIGFIITALILWFFVFKKQEIISYTRNIKFDAISIIQSGIIIIGVSTAFNSKLQIYTIVFALIAAWLCRLDGEYIKKLPLRGAMVWTAAFIVGNVTSYIIQTYFKIEISPYVYSLIGIISLFVLIAIITNFITNTGLTSILLPIVMGAVFQDKMWLFALVVKAIGISYCTVLADGCLAVSSAYGLKQKDLFKIGLWITVSQIIVFTVYFVIMKGNIVF